MKKDYIDFQATGSPLAYLITFLCYGTWLHGDERGSVDRNHRAYTAPLLPRSALRVTRVRGLMKQLPVTLDEKRRKAVEFGIPRCVLTTWMVVMDFECAN